MPQPPSFTDFSWSRIGSQPTLLKRLNEAAPNAVDEGRQYSLSPSPDLEEALIPSGSSPNDDTDQFQPQTKRNLLLDSLAPEADVDMDDMYVDDDVNASVGANLGPKEKEAQAQSGASLRPQLKQASNGQLNTTNKLSALSQPRSNAGSAAAKISSPSQEKSSAGTKAGSAIGNPAPGSTPTPISARNHTVPPTPPPENDQIGRPLGQAQVTINPFDSLRAVSQRLQSLLDDVSNPEVFTPVRDLIQGAKVQSHSVAIASQKAVTLSLKASACAQESLQASQAAVELARNAKLSWEATLKGCEQRIADQFAKQKQLQEAIKKELAAFGDSVRLLEAEDRRRTQQAEQEVLERQQAQEITADALNAPAATVGPSSLPTPPTAALPLNTASTSTALIAPTTEKPDDPAVSGKMVALLLEQLRAQNDEFKSLRNELAEFKKDVGNAGSSQTTPETQVQVSQPTRESPSDSQPLLEEAMDPKLKEEVLRNKLKSHKKLTTSASSAAPSRLPSNDLAASTQAQQTAASSVDQLKLEPIPMMIPEVKVKIEAQEAVPLPFRKPLSSVRSESMQLEYPPTPNTLTETKGVESIRALGSGPPQLSLACPGGNTTRPLLRSLSTVHPASDTSDNSPIHMDRQGSHPGSLPLFLSEDNSHSNAPSSSTGQSTERRLSSTSTAEFAREGFGSVREQAQHMTQEPVLPAIATLSEHSPTESSSGSSFSTPAPVPAVQPSSPSKKNKGKGRAQARPLPTATKPPASAQLPPKPPSSASQNTAGSISRPRTPSLNSSSMDLAQPISQANHTAAPAPAPAPPAPSVASRGGNVSIRRPGGPGRPLNDADRSYRPGRRQSRSRSPVRGRRDLAHRDYDHYSPPHPSRGRNDSVSVGRRRSPVQGRRLSPPPLRSRVMKVQGRRSPVPVDSASRPAPSAAGIKRPFEDSDVQGPASRRRIDESNGQLPASSSETFNEEWSRRADYHSSPVSHSPIRGAAGGVSLLRSMDDDRDRGRPGTAKPYLASRITESRYQTNELAAAVSSESLRQDDDDGMNNGYEYGGRGGGRAPSPAFEASSSKPNLIDRFSSAPTPVPASAPRNNHHLPTRDTTRPVRGRGGRGGGRGGAASGGLSHQSLNDRISASSSGNVHKPLLSRINKD